MSVEENVALVQGLAEAFARRDHESVFRYYHPEIEWDASRQAILMSDVAGVYHGHEGVRTFWRRWLSAWRDSEFEIEDVRGAGDEVALLIRNQRQWGRHSGVPTEFPPYGLVFTVRDGMVVRYRAYPDQESALAAAGLGG